MEPQGALGRGVGDVGNLSRSSSRPSSRSGRHEGGGRPVIRYTVAGQSKKGEDCSQVNINCKRGDALFSMFAVYDGHNGPACSHYCKRSMLSHVARHLPYDSTRSSPKANSEPNLDFEDDTHGEDDASWQKALPLAIAEGFLDCHSAFAREDTKSGTTATVAIVMGWTVTVANVGDSRAILDTPGGGLSVLSTDHRLQENPIECKRVASEGGELARLKTFEGIEVGPLRSWPGGLCVSRSIGDVDCGVFISPLPHVKQIQVPPSGGRIIIASDGLWDVLSSEKAAKLARGMTAAAAAPALVKESIRLKGLHDDITVMVIDMLPSDTPISDQDFVVVPKSATGKGFFSRLKTSRSKQASHGAVGKPNVLDDIDAQKGDRLHQRYLSSFCQSGGIFCSKCGEQISALSTSQTETSVRAGNTFCPKHQVRVNVT